MANTQFFVVCYLPIKIDHHTLNNLNCRLLLFFFLQLYIINSIPGKYCSFLKEHDILKNGGVKDVDSERNLGAQGEWKFHQLILHIFFIITIIWFLLDVE